MQNLHMNDPSTLELPQYLFMIVLFTVLESNTVRAKQNEFPT